MPASMARRPGFFVLLGCLDGETARLHRGCNATQRRRRFAVDELGMGFVGRRGEGRRVGRGAWLGGGDSLSPLCTGGREGLRNEFLLRVVVERLVALLLLWGLLFPFSFLAVLFFSWEMGMRCREIGRRFGVSPPAKDGGFAMLRERKGCAPFSSRSRTSARETTECLWRAPRERQGVHVPPRRIQARQHTQTGTWAWMGMSMRLHLARPPRHRRRVCVEVWLRIGAPCGPLVRRLALRGRNKRWRWGGMVMQRARVSVSPDSSHAVWGCYADDSRLGFEATESSSLPLNTQRECVGCCGCRHSNKRMASRRQGWSCLSRVCPWRTKTRAS